MASADVCLFLLGPKYGHIFPETGRSATHDEWVAAQAAGIPRLVYRKLQVEFEPDQVDFTRIVQAYATGVFRDSFETTPELQTKVVQKIKELEAGTSPLSFARLAEPPEMRWTIDDTSINPLAGNDVPLLELHVLPLNFVGHSDRELEQLSTSLVDRIRTAGLVRGDVALSPSRSRDHVAVSFPSGRPRSWDAPQPGELAEVRLYKTGQISTRATLPKDGLGSILDAEALPQQMTDLLKFIGALNIVQQDRIVVAAGVSCSARTSVDRFDPHQSRRSARLSHLSNFTLRTEADESVTLAALSTGAKEVAGPLSRALIRQHPTAR